MKILFLFLSCLCIGCQAFAAKVGLLIVATGKYDAFVDPLIESARKYFCVNHDVTYYVFSDGQISEAPDVVKVYQRRIGWPYDTLMRNSIYKDHQHVFSDEDYVFALDADMRFIDFVGEEIFGETVATMHPGYATTGASFPYEMRTSSKACMAGRKNRYYFAGGFFGGSKNGFIRIVEETTRHILQDLEKGIIAIWHDESHWNRYCFDHPPSVILTPSYCFVDLAEMGYSRGLAKGFRKRFPPKLLALTKDHQEYRSPL